MVGSAAEYPGLRRVEHNIEDTQVVLDSVTLEHLKWDDHGVLHQVVEYLSVENIYRT